MSESQEVSVFSKTEVAPDALHGSGPRLLQPFVETIHSQGDFRPHAADTNPKQADPKDVSALEIAKPDEVEKSSPEKVTPVSMAAKAPIPATPPTPSTPPVPAASHSTPPIPATPATPVVPDVDSEPPF